MLELLYVQVVLLVVLTSCTGLKMSFDSLWGMHRFGKTDIFFVSMLNSQRVIIRII